MYWDTLQKPVIGLAPMDGITDVAFRSITDKIGHPSLLFTEFTAVEGLHRGALPLLVPFRYHLSHTPTIAQIFGTELEAFYTSTLLVCALGFDGVDINMGCPDKSVSRRGAGAGLIRTPQHAKKIVATVKKAVRDWSEGQSLAEGGVHPAMVDYITKRQLIKHERKLLPVSVKTRIGFDQIVTADWIQQLVETQPVHIAVHGRTLRQLYSGLASWEDIGKAADIAHAAGVRILGNGDIASRPDALEKIATYHVDGVLIGRAAFGNPWVFRGHLPTPAERIAAAIEHTKLYKDLLPEAPLVALRKHLAWYTKGFEGAIKTRTELMQAQTFDAIVAILERVVV